MKKDNRAADRIGKPPVHHHTTDTMAVNEEEMRMAFDFFDKDGSGFITLEELRDTLAQIGQNKTLDELAVMLSRVDLNCDGQISFAEVYQISGVSGL
jgi:calcium-binding protein CML